MMKAKRHEEPDDRPGNYSKAEDVPREHTEKGKAVGTSLGRGANRTSDNGRKK